MIKYVHFSSDGLCIGYEPASTTMPARKSEVFKMTTVLCHKQDQYKKAVARDIATANIANGMYILVKLPKNTLPHEHFREIGITMLIGGSTTDDWFA